VEINTPGRVMALDVGERRIGVAASDADGILASPLTIVAEADETEAVKRVAVLVQEQQAIRVIVGLPRSLDGSLGVQAERVIAFVQKLNKTIIVPLEFRDERFTTFTAQQLLRSGGKKRDRKNKPFYDAAAAAILLQSYLDEKRVDGDHGDQET
jgi:putative Holliday junction resolvase